MIDDFGMNFIIGLIMMMGYMVLYYFTEPWLAHAFALCTIGIRLGEIAISVRETKERST